MTVISRLTQFLYEKNIIINRLYNFSNFLETNFQVRGRFNDVENLTLRLRASNYSQFYCGPAEFTCTAASHRLDISRTPLSRYHKRAKLHTYLPLCFALRREK